MSDKQKKRPHSGGGGPQKKNKGAWQSAKGGGEKAIPAGALGMFATCDAAKDRRAGDELINLLEEAFTRMGKAHVGTSDQPEAAAAAEGGSKSSSVDALLAAEVAQLKDKKQDRFKRHDPGVRGTLFIEFPKDPDCPSPEDVAVDIAQHVKDSRSLPSRHLMRLLPVGATCYVSTEDVTALAAKLAEKHFAKDAATIEFAVDFEHRSCDKLKRKDVIDILAQAVPQPPHKVNLSAPQKTILVQLVRNVCAVAVVPHYRELAKLNLRKLVEDEEQQQEGKQAGKKEDAADQKAAAEPDKAAAAAAEPKAAAAEGDAAAGEKKADAKES